MDERKADKGLKDIKNEPLPTVEIILMFANGFFQRLQFFRVQIRPVMVKI